LAESKLLSLLLMAYTGEKGSTEGIEKRLWPDDAL